MQSDIGTTAPGTYMFRVNKDGSRSVAKRVEVAAALARPTPGEEIYKDAADAVWTVMNREYAGLPEGEMRMRLRKCLKKAFPLAAQPASPPPTQGWEEALGYLEGPGSGHLLVDMGAWIDRYRHEVATLRSHLSGRETPQGWTREVPTEPGTYWLCIPPAMRGKYIETVQFHDFTPDDCGKLTNQRGAVAEAFKGCWFMPVSRPAPPTSERSEA